MGVVTVPTPRREGLILGAAASIEKAVKTSSLACASESRDLGGGGADDGAGAGTEDAGAGVATGTTVDRGAGEAGGRAALEVVADGVVGVGVVGTAALVPVRVGDAGAGAEAGEGPNNPRSLSVAGALVSRSAGVAGGGGATVGEDTCVNDPLVGTFLVEGVLGVPVVAPPSWPPLEMTLPGETDGFNDSPANKSEDIMVYLLFGSNNL